MNAASGTRTTLPTFDGRAHGHASTGVATASFTPATIILKLRNTVQYLSITLLPSLVVPVVDARVDAVDVAVGVCGGCGGSCCRNGKCGLILKMVDLYYSLERTTRPF